MPVHAEHRDGRVIVLEKDCGCLGHDGPHWLHMNDLWRASNRTLLPILDASCPEATWTPLFAAYAEQEHLRLTEWLWQMQSRNLIRLIFN